MIKANELRVGNLLFETGIIDGYENLPDSEKLTVIVAVINDIDQVVRDLQDNMHAYDSLYPIPLTEEWLLKFGFEKDWTGYALEDKNSLSFSVTKNGAYLACWLDRSLGITIKYVHQLQNLYFALTGEELTIKQRRQYEKPES